MKPNKTRSPASDRTLTLLRRIAEAALGAALICLPCLTLWAIEATARLLHGHP